MSSTPIVYAIEVTGADAAIGTIKGVEASTHGVSLSAGGVADAFKKVSRDIGTAGGAMSQFATHAGDELFSIVEVLGKGGVAGALAGVSLAAGVVSAAMTQWAAEEDRAEGAIASRAKAELTWIDQTRAALREKRVILDETFHAEASIEVELRKMHLERLESQKADLDIEIRNLGLNYDERQDIIDRRSLIELQIKSERKTLEIKENEKAQTTQAAFDEQEARNGQERADKIRVIEEKAAKEKKERLAAFMGFYGVQMKVLEAMQYDAAAKLLQQEKDLRAEREAIPAGPEGSASDYVDAQRLKADSLRVTTQALIDNRTAERHKEEAQRKSVEMMLLASAANTAYGASIMMITPIVGVFTDKLRALGDVNRENFQEFFAFSEETPAMAAKQAQGILAGIAAQAAGKAIFELAESGAQTGAGLFRLAIGDAPGASLHFAAATSHAGSAALYATIAGGTAGAALAIGASRGEGGLVGLTKEEREAKKNKDGKYGDGGGIGGSIRGGRGTSGGGGSGEGVTNVTFNYEAGAIAPANNRRAAETVALALVIARRDGYMNRRLRVER